MKKLMKMCLAIVLVITLVACSENTSTTGTTSTTNEASKVYTPGNYTGIGSGNNGDIKVEVELSEKDIVSVKVEHRCCQWCN